jgi:hypothetical protein
MGRKAVIVARLRLHATGAGHRPAPGTTPFAVSAAAGEEGPVLSFAVLPLRARVAVPAVAAVAIAVGASAGTAAAAPAPPQWTSSRYMDPVSTDTLYNEGYNLGVAVANGTKPDDAVVVLDYGGQMQRDGVWGAISIHSGVFHPDADLRFALQAFGQGFYYGTGANTTAHLTVALGTNNSATVSAAAGTAWATTIANINDWYAAGPDGFPYSEQVTAIGADDIEPGFCPSSACVDNARAWADAFSDATTTWYDNYGSCDGCPPAGPSPNGAWTTADIYHVSWGAIAAWPLPEIYANNGVQAAQWERVSEWGLDNGSLGAMAWEGTITQHQACAQVGCLGGPLDNTPEQGWTQLWNALDTRADYDGHVPPAGVAGTPGWSTDIAWTYGQ